MQISSKQIKLARISLDWTQPDLAERAGVSKDTIVNIETGKGQPHKATLNKIIDVLRLGGIEFLDGNGIRERENAIHRYEGVEGFRSFMDDVYETSKEYGGDICLFNSKPTLWTKFLGEEWYDMHSKRMEALGDFIKVRITVQEGEQDFILNQAEHRWFKRDKWKGKIFYAYGPKLGFLDFSKNSIQIVVFSQADFAESFRVLFDVAWENETVIPGN